MLRRALGATTVALIVALGGTGSAFACDTASITPDASAAPGDTVHWTAAGVLSGAVWKISLGDGTVIAGPLTSDGSVIHGTFTMPSRIGNAAGVSIELVIDHDDFGEDPQGTKTGWTAYEATRTPAQQSAPTPAPAPQQAPTAQHAAPQTTGTGGPAHPVAPAGAPRSPAPAQGTTHRVVAEWVPTVAAPARARTQPDAVAVPAKATAAVRIVTSAAPRHARHNPRSHAVRGQPRPAEAPQRTTRSAPRAQPVTAVSGSLPLRDLLAGGAGVLLLSLLALLWRRRAEPGGAPALPLPPQPDRWDAVEAELQTLLAEEQEERRGVAVGARDG